MGSPCFVAKYCTWLYCGRHVVQSVMTVVAACVNVCMRMPERRQKTVGLALDGLRDERLTQEDSVQQCLP